MHEPRYLYVIINNNLNRQLFIGSQRRITQQTTTTTPMVMQTVWSLYSINIQIAVKQQQTHTHKPAEQLIVAENTLDDTEACADASIACGIRFAIMQSLSHAPARLDYNLMNRILFHSIKWMRCDENVVCYTRLFVESLRQTRLKCSNALRVIHCSSRRLN